MKRNEKNLQMRQKIIESAFHEFSEKRYSDASINTICNTGNISKGIVYHYFKDKDELYLICIQECFDALTDYINNMVLIDNVSVENALSNYFDARIKFFGEHPLYLGVFFSAVVNPPAHLVSPIKGLMSAFETQTVSILTTLLKTVNLRSDISVEEVVKVFCEYQDFVNMRFQIQDMGKSALKEHEERCHRSLKILLYGVIEREVSV